MIWIILSSFAMGAGVGVAGCYSYRDFMVIATNAKLAVENNHLTGEVKRLRAQVALHIGTSMTYAPNADPNRVGQCKVSA